MSRQRTIKVSLILSRGAENEVYVAMSGGVDSSMAAALLKRKVILVPASLILGL